LLHDLGYSGPVSVELFNETYYRQSVGEIAAEAYRTLQPYLKETQ
jgi:sugar phosphate isomerase/epimerase